ncbi:MAG: hypothetical protein KDK39_02095 [Leptospiraceae bacterium]|nr:hypothetical protein [Leptospiraceae bacterium]
MPVLDILKIEETLLRIWNQGSLPDPLALTWLSIQTAAVLQQPQAGLRPADQSGRAGGLVLLDPTLETIIIPDLHARMDFLLSVLLQTDKDQRTILEHLSAGRIQIVCVGDGMHAERRAAERWQLAQREFIKRYRRHEHMDAEMRESLGLMQMIMELKLACPEHFHYLKGNHDNILNENGRGNFPFMKLALEGPMVAEYLLKFYGAAFLEHYSQVEHAFPLLAQGRNFLISHAEPARHFKRSEILNYRDHPDVVSGLTWTRDGQAAAGSVVGMLREYIRPEFRAQALYFGGHRPVELLYKRRAGGRYIQLHNPDHFSIARLPAAGPVLLNRDIFRIPNCMQAGS